MGKAHEMLMMRTEAFPIRTGGRHLHTLVSHDGCGLPLSCIPKRISGIHKFVNNKNNNRCKEPMSPLSLPRENKAVLII